MNDLLNLSCGNEEIYQNLLKMKLEQN